MKTHFDPCHHERSGSSLMPWSESRKSLLAALRGNSRSLSPRASFKATCTKFSNTYAISKSNPLDVVDRADSSIVSSLSIFLKSSWILDGSFDLDADEATIHINNDNKKFCSFIETSKNEIIRLLKLSELHLNNSSFKNEGSANLVVSNSTLIIPLSGLINTISEIKKLSQKKDKELIDLQKILSKLENKKFMEKAPKQVIEQFINQEQEIKSSIEKIDQIINTIS